MYLIEVKTALVMGLRDLFDDGFELDQLRNLHCSIEFPEKKTEYPSIWVDFEPARDLQSAGINHQELTSPSGVNLEVSPIRRWRFGGQASFTVASLSSHERDTIYDSLISDFAFAASTGGGQLRSFIENNPYIAMDMGWDKIATSGTAASPGTPWGTDDVIYETTIRLQLQGEFVSTLTPGSMLPLEEIRTYPRRDDEVDDHADGVWI